MFSFDLTKKNPLGTFGPLATMLPAPFLFIEIIKQLIDSGRNTTESQKKAAEDLIRAGKQNGVDEMEIKMQNSNGFKFKTLVEGCNIDTVFGNDNTVTLKVKYK